MGAIKVGAPKQLFELTDAQVKVIGNVAQAVLAVTALAGAVVLSAVAPNIFQLLDKVPWRKKTYSKWNSRRKDQQEKIAKSFYYLKKRGYVELKNSEKGFTVTITEKGREKIKLMQFKSMAIPAKGKWNNHWWLVLADVPSDPFRTYADAFRKKIKTLGFYPLQRTVWVYPFDPRDEVDFISAYYKIDRFVTIMEVVSLDPQDLKKLKGFFKDKGVI